MTVQHLRTGLEILRTLRPHQWVKNLFVLTPLVFGGQLTHATPVLLALAAFALFCALSGAVYLLNDIIDREKDRLHPLKQHRPIPAGRLSVRTAWIAFGAIVAGSLVGSLAINPALFATSAGYLALNVAYSLVLKHIVFVDVVSIALGFILRILAGAAAVAVPISVWLVLCTFLLALFLGLGKRKHELVVFGDDEARRRRVIEHYRMPHLDMALNIVAAVTTLVYLLYTQSERTVRVFGTHNLVFTLPFVVFGVVRYLQILSNHREEESPTDYIIKDIPFVTNLALWGITVILVIYVV